MLGVKILSFLNFKSLFWFNSIEFLRIIIENEYFVELRRYI